MAFPAWSKSNEKDLARFASADIGDQIRLASVTAELIAEGEIFEIVEELYDALAAMDIRWSRERYNPNLSRQEIREPSAILDGSGDGTCLDLALLFAGAALGKDLIPLVVVLDGHAFVAVSLTTDRRRSDGGARVRDDGDWVTTGLLSGPGACERLVALAAAGKYVLVECTGFAKTTDTFSSDTPEGRGRENGRLSFERAVEAGNEQLHNDFRPFAFAVDVAYLQDVAGLESHYRRRDGFDDVEADLRKRQARLLDDYTLVAGRDAELQALDGFVQDARSGYCLVTGEPGVGKTALLAEWIRRLQDNAGFRVVYHFLSRPHGTADSQHAFLQSTVQQALWAWGMRGRTARTVAELEARWLELLDVFNVPPRPVVIVIDGIDEATGWKVQKSILPRDLPDNVHIVLSARQVAEVDWKAALGIPQAALLRVQKLDAAGAKEIAKRLQVPDWLLDEPAFSVLIDRAQGDPFYLRLLCDLVAHGEVRTTAELAHHAKGLDNYVKNWWQELTKVAPEPAVGCLLSYLAVALAPITRAELVDIDEDDELGGLTFDDALEKINRYVTGDATDGGISLAHWRLKDYIGREVLQRAERRKIVHRIVAWCDRWDDHHFGYALRKGFSHHLERLALLPTSEQPKARTALVGLLGNSAYQRARVEKAGDTAALIADFNRLVSILATEFDSGAEDLIESSLRRRRARSEWLQPDLIFDLAEQGRYDDAMNGVAVLSAVGQWRSAAEVCIAWTAARRGCPDIAARLLPEVIEQGPPLSVLAMRVRHAIDPSAPEPELTLAQPPYRLPEEADAALARKVVERFGASDTEGVDRRGFYPFSNVYAVSYNRLRFSTENDAAIVVAAARDAQGEGLLTEYIELHASNPYASYRDRALWVILGAVACLPSDVDAQRYARRLCEGVFAPTQYWFAEALALTVTALRPGDGSRLLEREREMAVLQANRLNAQTSQLSGRLNQSVWDEAARLDQWSYLRRRLAAHAELAALSDAASAYEILLRAHVLPAGFAGYQAPACLSLAESWFIASTKAAGMQQESLALALTAAHNIQDPSFCARTTAHVNAITRLWEAPRRELGEMVDSLVSESSSTEFAATHVVGDRFSQRGVADHLPIDAVTEADTLGELAIEVFELPLSQLEAVNPELSRSWRLDPGTVVRVPDPLFIPIVASWLSARIVASDLAPKEKARLIARLVPVAGSNPTVLDTVLARLLYVSPGDADLDRVEEACRLVTSVEPPAEYVNNYH